MKGPNVFAGYWHDDEATARALTGDGWLRTGDIAVTDDDGYLFLVDRAKDLILVSGFNVFPAEVENALSEHPAVVDQVVVGVADADWGQRVHAIIQVVDPANPPTPEDLRASVTPRGWVEVFAIHWRGRNFVAAAGDNNYNSTGHDSAFYRSKRKYTELGLLRRTPIGGGVTFDAEARWHRIDDEESIAFFNTPWELSYRFIGRAPIDVVVRRR